MKLPLLLLLSLFVLFAPAYAANITLITHDFNRTLVIVDNGVSTSWVWPANLTEINTYTLQGGTGNGTNCPAPIVCTNGTTACPASTASCDLSSIQSNISALFNVFQSNISAGLEGSDAIISARENITQTNAQLEICNSQVTQKDQELIIKGTEIAKLENDNTQTMYVVFAMIAVFFGLLAMFIAPYLRGKQRGF